MTSEPRSKRWAVGALLLGLACSPLHGLAAGRSPPAVIAAAELAQGGTIHALRMDGAGHDFVVGQGWEAGGAWPRFNVEAYERAVQLLDNIERLGVDVERPISIHHAADGRRVGMEELRLAAGRLSLRNQGT